MLHQILELYGLSAGDYEVKPFGSGLINHTWKVNGAKSYILQHVNTNVFKGPEQITENIALLDAYLKKKAPGYLFVSPLPALSGKYLVQSADGSFFRLFPFVEGSETISEIKDPKEAFEAARQFGKFTFLLKDFDPKQLHYTLPQFHNLELRFGQFETALAAAGAERLTTADSCIKAVQKHEDILHTYHQIISKQELPLRVIHHDTKISNILFDQNKNGLCVIDLDTVMPGYFLSDTGDMLRTYLCPANEEETDFSKITISEANFYAVYEGYLSAMKPILTPAENSYFIYSGKYMIYMQALRFLADFLSGDSYYHATYPNQNLVRAQNQLTLLDAFISLEEKFQQFIDSAS